MRKSLLTGVIGKKIHVKKERNSKTAKQQPGKTVEKNTDTYIQEFVCVEKVIVSERAH